jgi:hypothetical protein
LLRLSSNRHPPRLSGSGTSGGKISCIALNGTSMGQTALMVAFLAPDLTKAAIDGRLPYGMGITRLTDFRRMVEAARDARLFYPTDTVFKPSLYQSQSSAIGKRPLSSADEVIE